MLKYDRQEWKTKPTQEDTLACLLARLLACLLAWFACSLACWTASPHHVCLGGRFRRCWRSEAVRGPFGGRLEAVPGRSARFRNNKLSLTSGKVNGARRRKHRTDTLACLLVCLLDGIPLWLLALAAAQGSVATNIRSGGACRTGRRGWSGTTGRTGWTGRTGRSS